MSGYSRYAIYYLPSDGALTKFGARWLGWDVTRGRDAAFLDVDGLQAMTETPRKYGFHATLKPPFRLAEGCTEEGLRSAVSAMAGGLEPGSADGLRLAPLGRFLALVPEGDPSEIGRVAAACVTELDAFRAPASDAELAHRRTANLTPEQDALLLRWGYPYVLGAFRFHMTLTGKLTKAALMAATRAAEAHLPDLPRPFTLDAVALVGERADGRFELVHRYALSG